MSKEDNGGLAFPAGCARCEKVATIKQGHQLLCDKHYRFGQMRVNAKRHGKSVPSHEELHRILPVDMSCPDCAAKMNWRSKDGQCSVASLQHYRDGSFGIVCRSCNTRHAYMRGDSFCEMEKDHKQCPCCGLIKHQSCFSLDESRSGARKFKSHCKECSDKSVMDWRSANRDQYNSYQRQYRAKRKEQGRPVRGGA